MQRLKFSFLALMGLTVCLCLSFSEIPKTEIDNSGTPTVRDTTKGGIRIPKTNWLNTMGCTFGDTMCVALWEDNVMHAKLVVRVTDPDIINYPDLHFFYAFQGASTPATIGYTGAVTSVSSVVFEDGTDGWEASFSFSFDMDYVCEYIYNDPGNPNGTGHFFFQVEYMLVTPIDNGFEVYPVADYPDLFDPEVFYIPSTGIAELFLVKKEICCFDETYVCTEDATMPYNNIANSNAIMAQGENVHTIVEPKDFDHSNITALQQEVEGIDTNSNLSHSNDFNVLTYPNPFQTEVMIHFEHELSEKDIQLKVYNALGKVLAYQEIFEGVRKGDAYKITTNDWPSGIYYFQFSTSHDNTVVKVVKQ